MSKGKYSTNSQISYHAGRAYAMAKQGRIVPVRGDSNKKSFLAGVKAEGGTRKKKFRVKNSSKPIKNKSKPIKNKSKPIFDYSDFFDFDERGRIKGSYTSDGFFEPD